MSGPPLEDSSQSLQSQRHQGLQLRWVGERCKPWPSLPRLSYPRIFSGQGSSLGVAETWLGNRRSQKCCSCFTFPINLSSNFFEPPCQYRRKLSIRLTCFNAPRMDGVEPALLLSLFEYLSVRVVLQPTVKGGEWEFDHFPRA